MFIMHRADGREEGGRDPPHPPFMKNPPSFHVKRSRIFLAIDTHLIPRLERGFLRDGGSAPMSKSGPRGWVTRYLPALLLGRRKRDQNCSSVQKNVSKLFSVAPFCILHAT